MLHVRLFGNTCVLDGPRMLGPGDFGGVKPRRILEALALGRGHPVSKDRLVDVLWANQPPADHVATLESYVSLLRRRLQPGTPLRCSAVRTVPRGYLLDPTTAQTDLDLFDELVSRAESGPDTRRLLDRASALAVPELLSSPDETGWAEGIRADYRQRAIHAALRAAELALRDDDAEDAARLAGRALGLNMHCEPGWRLVMRAHLATGRRDAGLRAYRSCRRLLARDLGIEPAPETRAVLVDLVRGQRGPGRGGRDSRGPRTTVRPGGSSTDLAVVLDAALALFEHQRGGRTGPVDDATRIIATLIDEARTA